MGREEEKGGQGTRLVKREKEECGKRGGKRKDRVPGWRRGRRRSVGREEEKGP